MLTRIRDRASGWIAWAIVILISIPFALWGINSYFEGASKVVVATADGIEIEQEAYQQALTQQQRSIVQLSGRNLDPEFFSSDEFKRQVVDQLIDQALQSAYIRSRGYQISDQELNLTIQKIPAFLTDGSFDSRRYRELLDRAGFSISGFEEQQRREATFNQVERSIVATAIASKYTTDNLIKLLLQERQARYVTLDLSAYLEQIIVTDEDIRAQYEENGSTYFLPADVKVDYVVLSIDKLSQEVVLDTQQVRAAYDDDLDRFIQPESRFVRHILFKVDEGEDENRVKAAQVRADQVVLRIRSGDDFAEVAEETSDDAGSARRGGDLGLIQPGTMPSSFEKAASILMEGEVSDPIRTEYGFHVIQVYSVIPQTRKSYEDVREQLAAELKRSEAEARFVEMSEDFHNISYEQADSLDPLAEELNLEINRSDWFSIDSGEDLFGNATLRQAAFVDTVLLDGLNSEAVEVDLDTLVVMRKIAYREKRAQELSEVRATIAEGLRTKRAVSKLELEGQSIVEKLRLGDASWSKLLADQKWEDKVLPSIGDGEGLLESSIRSIIYSAAPPGNEARPVYGSGWVSGRLLIYELSAVIDGDVSVVSDTEREEMHSLALRRDGMDMLKGVEQGLRAAAEVEIFPSQL